MKNLFTAALLFFALPFQLLQAQSKPLPGEAFSLSSPTPNLAIEAGQTQPVMVELNRSKSFRKVKIALSVDESNLPKGVSVRFEPNETLDNTSQMTIQASSDVQPGRYPILVAGKGLNYTRSFLLMLITKEKSPTANRVDNH